MLKELRWRILTRLSIFAELYKKAQHDYDPLRMADCLLQTADDLCAYKDDRYQFLLKGVNALLYAATYYLRIGETYRSMECFNAYGKLVKSFSCGFCYEAFVLGADICYVMGQYEQSIGFLQQFCEKHRLDDEVLSFFGSLLCHQGQYEQGREKFLEILTKHPNHPEAAINLALVDAFVKSGNKTDMGIDYLQHLYYGICNESVNVPTGDSWRYVPIIINSRDRLGCLKTLLGWLLNAGYRRIYILDNGSSYKPLLKYYDCIRQDAQVEVVYLQNIGHTALWEADILYKLGIDGMFVYTDSDVVPIETCPHDVVRCLVELLVKYPDIDKVGLGIVTSDIFEDWAEQREYQEQFYHIPLEKDVWFAHIDTTFALHRPRCPYRMMKSIRTTGDMMVKHLPWYMQKDALPEDEKYYVEHANASSNFAVCVRRLGKY